MTAIDPVTAVFNLGQLAIEKIWPDPTKRAQEVLKLEQLKQSGDERVMEMHVKLLIAQINTNAEEAKHKSIFVAGWRPFVGWIGGISFAYISIIEPFWRFMCMIKGYTGEFPVIDTTVTMQVLMGMLGLGIMRSFDKKNGTQTDALTK